MLNDAGRLIPFLLACAFYSIVVLAVISVIGELAYEVNRMLSGSRKPRP